MTSTNEKAHVLLFPLPLQGHLPPMLDLAQLLSNFNLHVTVVDYNFFNPVQGLHHYSALPNFRFLKLNDTAHREVTSTAFIDLVDLAESRRLSCREEYRRLLGSVDGWPPVTCVVADGFLPLTLDVPEEMNIPIFILRTSGVCSVWAYYCLPRLIENGEFPFQDESDMDKEIHSVPGMEGVLRRRDLPSFIRNAKSTDDKVLQFILTIGKNLHRARALIFNTVEAVEEHVLSHFTSVFPTVYNVGPLHKLVPQNANIQQQREETCWTWLNAQSPKSVVYISFGSTTKMSKHDFLEFWHGLMNSGYPFLWVIRKDLVIGDASDNADIVQELEDDAKERGCIVVWAPQKEVLEHRAVGCFLTHSGWNSVLESIAAGVPMITWPFWGDQMVNSRFVGEVWKIGMDMKDMMGRSVVEKMVREVMDGERADEMRNSVEVLSKLTAESMEEEGSSSMDLKGLVQHIISLSDPTAAQFCPKSPNLKIAIIRSSINESFLPHSNSAASLMTCYMTC